VVQTQPDSGALESGRDLCTRMLSRPACNYTVDVVDNHGLLRQGIGIQLADGGSDLFTCINLATFLVGRERDFASREASSPTSKAGSCAPVAEGSDASRRRILRLLADEVLEPNCASLVMRLGAT
jgi:hypothetical protein